MRKLPLAAALAALLLSSVAVAVFMLIKNMRG